ncbi:MAG: ChbG/HpnK family deacetylase [Nitrospiraceae bacterium]|nr:ChbG/HpnK family deacetylase [Nitrospiraceae bacterium]
MFTRRWTVVLAVLVSLTVVFAANAQTYAERLGWGALDRVVIFHVDDVGMCHGANMGAIEAMTDGVATSASVMFPCSWVSGLAVELESHPGLDVGIHLTLTSEWLRYRWGPLAGKNQVPNLVDPHGCLWPTVEEVITHANAIDVEKEVRAQIERCLAVGITPTHLDSHMGTLFATSDFRQVFLDVGVELGIPILAPGGHLQHVLVENGHLADAAIELSQQAWDAGLPAIDDLCTGLSSSDPAVTKANVINFLDTMLPGITEVILHCTRPSGNFPNISASGASRLADTLAMIDPDVRQFIEDEGIILTTWRELKERRDAVTKAQSMSTLTVPEVVSAPAEK